MVRIKDYEFDLVTVSNSHYRRAQIIEQKILKSLKPYISEDDIDVSMEVNAILKAQASVTWYMWDRNLFLSYNGCNKFVENLAMVAKVLEFFLNKLNTNEISQEQFIRTFKEDHNVLKQRKEARKILGIHEDTLDFTEIHTKFKTLAKEFHPDMPNGDIEKFKGINNAHKTLRKELNER